MLKSNPPAITPADGGEVALETTPVVANFPLSAGRGLLSLDLDVLSNEAVSESISSSVNRALRNMLVAGLSVCA
jgi:hypothetical protein